MPLRRPKDHRRARAWSAALAIATAMAVVYMAPWAASRWRAASRVAALLRSLPDEFQRLAEGAVASAGPGGWSGEVRAGSVVAHASVSWDRAMALEGETITLEHPVIEFVAPTYRVIASAGAGSFQFESLREGWPLALRLDGCVALTVGPPGDAGESGIMAEAAEMTVDLLSLSATASGGCRVKSDGGVLETEMLRVRVARRDLRPTFVLIDAGRIQAVAAAGSARLGAGVSRPESSAWFGPGEAVRLSTEGRVRWDSDGRSVSAGRVEATIVGGVFPQDCNGMLAGGDASSGEGFDSALIEWSTPVEIRRIDSASLAAGTRSGVVLEGDGADRFEFLDRLPRLYASAERAEFDFASRRLTLEGAPPARPARVILADGARLESPWMELDVGRSHMTGVGAGALILEGAAGTIRDSGSRQSTLARSLRWRSGFEAEIDRPAISSRTGAGGPSRGVLPRLMRAWGSSSLASDAGRLLGDEISVSWSQAYGADGAQRMALSQVRADGRAWFESTDGRTSAGADRLLAVIDHSPAEARESPLILSASGNAMMRTPGIEACGRGVSAMLDVSRRGSLRLERVSAQGDAEITHAERGTAAGERVSLVVDHGTRRLGPSVVSPLRASEPQ